MHNQFDWEMKDRETRAESERILVCLSSSPSNAKIIRSAAQLARAFHGRLTALFVESSRFAFMSRENKERLQQNIRLAEQSGASVETSYGEDIALQIAEFARLSGITRIVLGRSSTRSCIPGRPCLTDRIAQIVPNIDIYIIPDETAPSYRLQMQLWNRPIFVPGDFLKCALILLLSTLIGLLFEQAGFSEANIITVYILGVLLIAVSIPQRVYSLVSSAISVVLFNYFFTKPVFTLHAAGAGYPATFLIMFAAAFLTSSLTVRIKNQTRQSAETAYRTRILFDTNRLIGNERDPDGIISVTCRQLNKLLNMDILFYRVQEDHLLAPQYFPATDDSRAETSETAQQKATTNAETPEAPQHRKAVNTENSGSLRQMADTSANTDRKSSETARNIWPFDSQTVPTNASGKPVETAEDAHQQKLAEYTSANEQAVADWAFRNNRHAGATTDTLCSSKCLYLSVRVGHDVYGVIGVAVEEGAIDAFENSIMLSILGECALALKNEKVTREREEAALLAKNEQLRANLLRSISHDLRTPLTSISGNAGILLSSEDSMDRDKRRQLYTNIYDDSLWLINLVENLLSVTRIENGTMKLRFSTELLDEIITEAMHHTSRRCSEHHVIVKPADNFILVRVDSRLIVQVLTNLVDNAVKYTPPGSEIVIASRQEKNQAIVTVSDNGNGVADSEKAHIFDMFYTANTKIVDSRRSMGLGLALCKSIVAAHGGSITVTDNVPHGAVFTFTLPTEEVKLHEQAIDSGC